MGELALSQSSSVDAGSSRGQAPETNTSLGAGQIFSTIDKGEYRAELRSSHTNPSGITNYSITQPAPFTPVDQEIKNIIAQIRDSGGLGPEFAKALAHDLAHPENINQGMNATCTVATIQKLRMVTERPLEYARMVRDLAVDGKYTFNDLEQSTVTINLAALDRTKNPPEGVPPPFEPRSITEAAVQEALTRYAIGETDQAVEAGTAKLRYDPFTDKTSGTYQGKKISYQGLFEDQIIRALQGVTGMKYDRIYAEDAGTFETILHELDSGPVPVLMKWAESGVHQLHALGVTKIENGIVYLYNPPGKTEEMSLANFKEKLSTAFIMTNNRSDGTVPKAPLLGDIQVAQALTNGTDPTQDLPVFLELQIKPTSPDSFMVNGAKSNSGHHFDHQLTASIVPLEICSLDEARKALSAEVSREAAAPKINLSPRRGTFFTDDDELFSQETRNQVPLIPGLL